MQTDPYYVDLLDSFQILTIFVRNTLAINVARAIFLANLPLGEAYINEPHQTLAHYNLMHKARSSTRAFAAWIYFSLYLSFVAQYLWREAEYIRIFKIFTEK